MGIIVRQDTHDNVLHPAMESIKADLFNHSSENLVILHRSEILRKIGPFLVMEDPEIKEEFDRRFLALVVDTPYLSISAAIDKLAHVKKYIVWQHNPYHYCLECILERYVKWLKRRNYYGDVLIEARTTLTDKRLKNAYKFFYENGTEYCKVGDIQSRLISKEPKFKTKNANISALQLADLLAHPTHKYMRNFHFGFENPQDYGQSLVQELIKSKLLRNPRDHSAIWGWGLKWLP